MRRISQIARRIFVSAEEKYSPIEEAKAGEVRRYRAFDRAKSFSCSWSSDSRFVAIAGQDVSLFVFDTHRSLRGPVHKFITRSRWNSATGFSPDRKFVCVGGSDNVCSVFKVPESIFDAKAMEEKAGTTDSAVAELIGHEGLITSCDFADEKRIVTCSEDCSAKLWDLESREVVKSFTTAAADVSSASAKLDKGLLVTGSCDSKLRVLDAQSGAETAVFTSMSDINSVKIFCGCSLVVCGTDDGSVIVLTLPGASVHQRFHLDSSVTAVDASPTGRFIIAACESGLIRIWDLSDGSMVQEIRTPSTISALRVAPGGGHFATSGWDGYLRIWRFPFP